MGRPIKYKHFSVMENAVFRVMEKVVCDGKG
jgi:hypothetical protein